MSEPVRVYAYWDYSCPFSRVAAHRIRRLADERPLDVSWRPYEIHPGLPEEGIPAKELGYAPDDWSRLLEEVDEMARREGLELRVPSFVPRTSEPLQAALFARDLGRDAFRRLHRALFQAFFAEGINIGRREALLEVAGRADVDREGLSRALEDERYAEELRRVRSEAERYDIDGTPSFLFGRHKVVGAAPMEVLREAAGRAAGEELPAAGPTGGEGDPGQGGAAGPAGEGG